jgi:hypothetical protein
MSDLLVATYFDFIQQEPAVSIVDIDSCGLAK